MNIAKTPLDSGELKPYDKAYVTVRYANDPKGKCFHVKTDDPRYLSGELVHNLKGRPLPDDVKEKMKAGYFIIQF